MTAAAHPPQQPIPSSAAALRAAFEQAARERPELADRLPWGIFSDPAQLKRFERLDADAARIRAALEVGATPEELGLVEGGLDRALGERGLP